MARTLYENHNAEFSNKAHIEAQDLIYPVLFRVPRKLLSYESTLLGSTEKNSILDGEMGVDRIVKVTVDRLNAPLVFTVQERFRRPQYSGYRDLTITEWNHASGLPSELYKINAGLFVYGYYDEWKREFKDTICVNVTDLLMAVANNTICYIKRRNKKGQDFLAFGYDDLVKSGVVVFYEEHVRRREIA